MANEVINIPLSSTDMWVNWVDAGGTSSGSYQIGWRSGLSSKARGAIRFPNVAIPKNSTFSTADLHVYVSDRFGSDQIYIKAWGVDEDNTSWGSQPFGKTKTTASNTFDSNPSSGQYMTIGVASILEEIVSRSGWTSGNAIGFIIEDNGTTQTNGENYIRDYLVGTDSFLHYRIAAAPNFKPTPKSVSAPSLPTAQDVGMKFSLPGVSVFDATDEQTYLTTRKRQFKVFMEDYYQSVSGDVSTGYKAIAHNLGYVPFVSVHAKSSIFGGGWKRLPVSWAFEDHPAYGIDDTYLYLHSAIAGEEFYYRIFLDRIV